MAVYFDLNLYSPTKKAQVFDVDSIYQSIAILLNTRPGEVLFNPEFGVPFEETLFEFVDTASSLAIFTSITDAIQRFEPRVQLDNGRTTVTPVPDENRFDLELYFTVPSLSAEAFTFVGSFNSAGV